jgi:hypothetical protein
MFPYCGNTRLRYSSLCLMLLVSAICAAPAWGIEPYQFDAVEPKVSAQLPQGVADHLDSNGALLYTYSNGLRTPFCEVFWAKAVMLQGAHSKSSRFTYGDLKPGSFVGVIHFLPEAADEFREDFHDQKLKPAFYTMRYALTSDADAHDVVLLSPAGLDSDAGRVLPPDQLMRLSRMASRTQQPAVMSLVPAEISDKDSPNVRTSDDGTCILQVKLHAQTGGSAEELDFAIIVVKPIPDIEGS